VAKESADIILLEKSLMVLDDGIIEGRKVFGNIVKYIRMGASSNFGNMFSYMGFSIIAAAMKIQFLPMIPLQVLLNNMLYDFSQTGIPFDNVDKEFLYTPRKWSMGGIRRFMIYIGPISSIFDYATFALMLWFFMCHTGLQAPAALAKYFHNVTDANRTYAAMLFQSGWFVESLLTQTLIVHVIRTRRIPFLQSWASAPLILTTIAVMAVGAVLPYTPVARFFNLVPLPPIFWAWIAGFLVAYVVLTHFVKTWFFNKFGID